ncbi:hypothetical protein VSR01_27510 [Actinacidiphila sp. DG2A-62]|uniref:ATP-grasp domain-containing protein n=1 Tax=Actinacidiphila sp. DG2A-62 TaxID=3108821 RepID=UPI002DC0588E|nr:hypothetical protein [Actinacidiphila sp. DG2A-62]MEC3997050.1 hypothetical protein [Actinacidiphila sp. DG2A-62]
MTREDAGDSARPSVKALLIGDSADPHIKAVVEQLPARGTVVVDASTLPQILQRLGLGHSTLIDETGQPVDLAGSHPAARGWIRRLAPAGWDDGPRLGSHAAARLASRMTLLAALLRDASTNWLCNVDSLFAAENKIVQYRAARAAGIRVPETLVSAGTAELTAAFGERFVVKPLGPGSFTDDQGNNRIVHTQVVTANELAGADLLGAPFLAQQLLVAQAHLRVVTVRAQAWTAELDATGLPLDWREAASAHHSFAQSAGWPTVERQAVHLARALGTGFSCQDWIVDSDGPAFVDLNPGGQWLFLPDSLTRRVAERLAKWLRGN